MVLCACCVQIQFPNVFSVYPYLTPADVLVQTLFVTILISNLYVSQSKNLKECSGSIQVNIKATVVDCNFVNEFVLYRVLLF